MPQECEAKIKVASLNTVRAMLEDLGAAHEGTCLERNWVLDNPDGGLRREGILLRVRNMGDEGGILTVKHPVKGPSEFKTREEIECMVDSTGDLLRQLEVVGFRVAWIYEKQRQTWLWRDCVIALDECPEIGSFVEIEGVPERIREVAVELGLDPEDHIDDNYLGLWQKHLRATGQPARHMLFVGEEAEHRRNAARSTTRIRPRQ